MDEETSEKDLIHMANQLLIRFGRKPSLKCIDDCDHQYFVGMYQLMVGEVLPGLTSSAETVEDSIHNVQVVIDSLSADILGVDLSHIDAQQVVNKDKYHVSHLVEIFEGLLDFVLEELDKDKEVELTEQHLSSAVDESADSDRLADDHEILSGVFLEEFGPSYHDNICSGQPYNDTISRCSHRGEILPPTKGEKVTKSSSKVQRKPVAYFKERLPALEVDDGVSWTSGNRTHTIGWSKVDSPSEYSTGTEELIKLAQTRMNSTDDLIKEAQVTQNDVKTKYFQRFHQDQNVGGGENGDKVIVTSFSNWTSALSSSTSTLDSSDLAKESRHQRPRRQRLRKKDEKKETYIDKKSDLPTESSQFSEISSSSYASLDDLQKRSEMTIDSLQSTKLDMGDTVSISTTSNDTWTIASKISEGKSFIENSTSNLQDEEFTQTSRSACKNPQIAGANTSIADTGLDGDVLHIESTKGNVPTERVDFNVPHAKTKPAYSSSGATKKIQSNMQLPSKGGEKSSKKLEELSGRLQKLRKDVKTKISMSLSNATTTDKENVDTTISLKDKKSLSNATAITEKENVDHSTISVKDKKEKSKVSFALDSDSEKCMSDSEVDYYSPEIRKKRSTSHRRSRNVYQSPRKGILKRKQALSDATNDEVNKDPLQAMATKFEKPLLKKDERLRNVCQQIIAADEENQFHVEKLRKQYSKQHGRILSQKNELKKQSNLQLKEKKQKEEILQKFAPSNVLKTSPTNKYAAKVIGIYGEEPVEKSGRKKQGKKRSASTSPVRRRKYKTPLVLQEDDILPVMEEEFPFIYLSPHTAKLLWQKQLRQVNNLRKSAMPHKTSKIQKTVADALRKQKALADIMKKEVEHNKRLKELQEKKDRDTIVRRNLQERRQRSARARRYYDEYAIRNKAKMLKKRTKEEKIFKGLFEDALDIQKERIKEIRGYAREQKEKNAKRQQDEIESLENFYRDKFSVLAESIAQEKFDLELRQKAQAQVLGKMRSEMRKRMEKDLTEIQAQLANDDDAYLYRQLDADILKKEFQLATYKTSKRK